MLPDAPLAFEREGRTNGLKRADRLDTGPTNADDEFIGRLSIAATGSEMTESSVFLLKDCKHFINCE